MDEDGQGITGHTTLPVDVDRVRGKLRVVVMTDEGVRTLSLPEAGEIIFGRSPKCSFPIFDPSLSRQHLRLQIGKEVWIEDLGSANGTRVGDRALEPRQPVKLSVGDAVSFGGAVLLLQAEAIAPPRQLCDRLSFERRVLEECGRATAEHPCAVLRIRRGGAADSARLLDVVSALLRAQDVVGEYSPDDYCVLVRDADASAADGLAKRLRQAIQARGAVACIGVASFPNDVGEAKALVEAARGRTELQGGAHASPALEGAAMARIRPLIERVASSNINVLILGETGVGKEVLAEIIHNASPRAKSPLLRLNCAALAESLVESELFGYEKGAFTGAEKSKAGLLETANGGTVLLDEVGEMPLATQAKLLRVLQERQLFRVGALAPRPIDVRLIAATNRDLERACAAGQFRSDLFFRLNGIAVTVPPLRERLDEIDGLARLFIVEASRQLGLRSSPVMSEDVSRALLRHAWPGNIRELRNVMERAVVLCREEVITLDHLPQELGSPTGAAPPHSRASANDAVDGPNERRADPEDDERERILRALDECAGNQTRAAQLLGMSRRTLVSRIATLDIPRPRKPRDTRQ